MRKHGASKYILGVMVSSRTVDAVLVENGPEGPVVQRAFRRHRHLTQGAPALVTDLPDEQDQDVMITYGEAGGGSHELFLGSEFDGLEATGESGDGVGTIQTPSFELELLDILQECEDAGYDKPDVAFCNGTVDVKTYEVPVVDDDRGGEKDGKKKKARKKDTRKGDRAVGRSRLLELLAEKAGDESGDLDRAAFIPMTPSAEGVKRFLAIVPRAQDPVLETVQQLRERKQRMPAVRLLDTEVALYLGLARMASRMHETDPAEPDDPAHDPVLFDDRRRTLVVRAGMEDTLVMFMEEETLQHFESLRSITTYDAPETICSRVLLLQDEYGTGDVQHVLILGEEREGTLIESFALFFPDARVESIRQYVPALPEESEEKPSQRRMLLASTVTLRLAADQGAERLFHDVNLLPARLLKKQIRLPISWHVVALYVLLFGTVLFFMARYFSMEQQTRAFREQMQAQASDVVEADAKVLQARIDSMKAASTGYLRALDVLDSLLVGSDIWSRSLAKTSREAGAVSGVWIESWRQDGSGLEIEGNATSRSRVVALADRLDSSIESLSFSEIREWPVFSFRMRMPLRPSLPEAATYLRKNVQVDDATASTLSPGSSRP